MNRCCILQIGSSMLMVAAVMGGACAGPGPRAGSTTSAAQLANAQQPAKPSPTAYPVRVEISEVKNRIVEGKVRGHTVRIDQPREFGADDTAPTPPETLAFALGSCLVSTGRLIAIQRNMTVRSFGAVVEGELDFARALGTSQSERAGFRGFRVTLSIDADLTPETKQQLVGEIAARCPMCDNVANETPLTYGLAH